jgi:hypothetical protein
MPREAKKNDFGYEHEIDTADLRPKTFYENVNHAINGQWVAIVEEGKVVAVMGPPPMGEEPPWPST